MKMKTCFVWIAIIFIISIQMAYTQSISFSSPTEGQVVVGTSSGSETNVTVNYTVNGTITGSNVDGFVGIKVYANSGELPILSEDVNYSNGFFTYSGSITRTPGTYKLIVTLQERFTAGGTWVTTASSIVNFHVKHSITISNSFGAGSINVNNGTTISGAKTYEYIGETLALGAVDQLFNGYYYTWNTGNTSPSNWQRQSMHGNQGPISGATTRNYSYTVASNDNGATITSDMRRRISITFQNYMVGLGNVGAITVNGSQCSPPSNNTVIQGDQITVTAPTQTINGILYNLSSWSNGSTSAGLNLTPSENATYVANYIGRPSTSNLAFGLDLTVGQPIRMHWTDNPNTNVNYGIWRCTSIIHGEPVNPSLIGSVQKGVQTFTDDMYTYSGLSSDPDIYYTIVPYYSIEGTTANYNWLGAKGKIVFKENASSNNMMKEAINGEIKEYSIGCYPNPFNPSTTIEYQLPQDGFVTIKVYDILGREVKTLVNEVKSLGKYSVNFNASNLASGIYIYQLKANGFSSIKKMILTK